MSVAGVIRAAALACFCLLAPRVSAQAASSRPLSTKIDSGVPDLALAISFVDLPSCVDEATLERRVALLVRRDRLNPARRVHGVVGREGTGRFVQFQVFEGAELVGSRRLLFDDHQCEPFREAVELVLAMLLEGQGFEPPSAASTEPVPEPEPEPLPGPPAPPARAERPPSSSPRLVGRFRVGGELSLGVLPTPSAGIRVEGGVEFAIPLALLGRATWHLDDAIPIDGGGQLDFGAYRLAALACYLHRGAWVVSACGGVGFVSIEASGVGVPGARAARFDQGAALVGARLGIPLGPSWSVELGTEIETWFSRPEYVLLSDAGPQILATASGVPVVTWLALGYAF